MKSIVIALSLLFTATAFAQEARLCATAFAHQEGDEYGEYTHGYKHEHHHHHNRLEILDGSQLNDLRAIARGERGGDWDNVIERIIVEPGCWLTGYQYRQFNVRENSSPAEGMPYASMFTLDARDRNECSLRKHLEGRDYETTSSLECNCDQEYSRHHEHHHHHHNWDGDESED